MEVRPTMFLDLDGVMATENEYGCKKTHPLLKCYPFNKTCVKVLNNILEETNAVIVLSSDWKYHYTLDQLNEIFVWNGIITPLSETTAELYKHFGATKLEECRAMEILEYVEKHNIITYVAVDDLHMGQWLNGNFVHCSRPREGIKQSGVSEKIINVLKPTT